MEEDPQVLGKRVRDTESGIAEPTPVAVDADDDDDDDDVGPLPLPAAAAKKKRKGASPSTLWSCKSLKEPRSSHLVLPHEQLYLDHLPNADQYYKSFMHRDVINFCVVTVYAITPSSTKDSNFPTGRIS